MPVIKSTLQTHYFIYPNSVAQSILSLESKGLIAYMSSKPDDWVFHKSVIMDECKIGRDKLNRLFGELELSGHLVLTQYHDEEGKFSRSETMFFVEPSNNPAFIPCTEKPLTVKPYTVNQPLQSKDINKVKNNTNDFDIFWAGYPKKTKKPAAQRSFNAALKKMEDPKGFAEFAIQDCLTRFEGREKKFIPDATTYLNNFMWEDEICN